MGNILVLIVLGVLVGLAAGSLWKQKKQGGCCGSCSHCSGNCAFKQEKS